MAAPEPAGELARLMAATARAFCSAVESVAPSTRALQAASAPASAAFWRYRSSAARRPEIDREGRRAEQDDEGQRDDDEDLARLAACHQLITIVTVARRLIMSLVVCEERADERDDDRLPEGERHLQLAAGPR